MKRTENDMTKKHDQQPPPTPGQKYKDNDPRNEGRAPGILLQIDEAKAQALIQWPASPQRHPRKTWVALRRLNDSTSAGYTLVEDAPAAPEHEAEEKAS